MILQRERQNSRLSLVQCASLSCNVPLSCAMCLSLTCNVPLFCNVLIKQFSCQDKIQTYTALDYRTLLLFKKIIQSFILMQNTYKGI